MPECFTVQSVFNATVSTKTRPTQLKQVRKLRATLHASKRNATVSVKEEHGRSRFVFVHAIKCGYGVCVCMCLSSSTHSPVDSYLCVYVMEAILKVPKRGAPRDVCVFVTRDQSRFVTIKTICDVGMDIYVCVCLSSSLHPSIDS